jgi:hypothetical protein
VISGKDMGDEARFDGHNHILKLEKRDFIWLVRISILPSSPVKLNYVVTFFCVLCDNLNSYSSKSS